MTSQVFGDTCDKGGNDKRKKKQLDVDVSPPVIV